MTSILWLEQFHLVSFFTRKTPPKRGWCLPDPSLSGCCVPFLLLLWDGGAISASSFWVVVLPLSTVE